MKRILIDANKCMGCKSCSIACIQSHRPDDGGIHTLNLQDPKHESRNIILTDSQKKYKPLFCRHCANPSCVKSCMSGAMTKDIESGHVIYDPDKCGQCFMCVMNCPFGVLKPDRATGNFIVKCNFCIHKDDGPQCVKNCPTGAIHVKEVKA